VTSTLRTSSPRTAERRGLLLAFAVFGSFWGAWSATLPAVRTQAHLSDGQLGIGLAAIAFSAVPVMPFAGRLVDRFGARRALPAAMFLFALVLPLAAFAHSLAALVPALVLLGLATGGLDVIANTAVAAWERVEGDRLMSVAHGAFSVGVLVGSASAGLARQAGAGPLPILGTVTVLVLVVVAGQPAYRQADQHEVAGTRAGLSAVLLAIGLLSAGAFLCEDAIGSWSAASRRRASSVRGRSAGSTRDHSPSAPNCAASSSGYRGGRSSDRPSATKTSPSPDTRRWKAAYAGSTSSQASRS